MKLKLVLHFKNLQRRIKNTTRLSEFVKLLLRRQSAGDWQRGSAGRLFHLEDRVCVRFESATLGRRCGFTSRGQTRPVFNPTNTFPSSPMVLKVGALRVVLALVLRRIAVVGTVFRRWCGGRGFSERAGLQTCMRTAARWP